MTRYDSPAQQQLMQTYSPVPFQELMQAGAAKQNSYDQGAAAKDAYYSQLSNVKVAPGQDEQDYNDKIAKLSSSLKDLTTNTPDMSSYEFKSNLNNIIREQNKDSWWRNAQQNRDLYVKAAQQVQEEKNKGNVDYNLLPAYQYMHNFEKKGTQGLMQEGNGMFQLPGTTKYADYGERMDKILNEVKPDSSDVTGYDSSGYMQVKQGHENRTIGKLVQAGMSRIGEFSSTLEGQNFNNKLTAQLGHQPTQEEYLHAYHDMVTSIATGKVYHKANYGVNFDKSHGDWQDENSGGDKYQYTNSLSVNKDIEDKASNLSQLASLKTKPDESSIANVNMYGTMSPTTSSGAYDGNKIMQQKQQAANDLRHKFPELWNVKGNSYEETLNKVLDEGSKYYSNQAKNLKNSTFAVADNKSSDKLRQLTVAHMIDASIESPELGVAKDFSDKNNVAKKLGYDTAEDLRNFIADKKSKVNISTDFDKGKIRIEVPYKGKGNDKMATLYMNVDDTGNNILKQGNNLKEAFKNDQTYTDPSGGDFNRKVSARDIQSNPSATHLPGDTSGKVPDSYYVVVGSPSISNPDGGKKVIRYFNNGKGEYVQVPGLSDYGDVNNALSQLHSTFEEHYK
jgi:hypothetical protein